MAVNPYFGFNENVLEQNLLDDLTQEAIKIHGVDVYYLTRERDSEDKIFGEARNSAFRSAHQIEMYIRNVDNFEGEGDLMSRFGFQVRDAMVLTVANSIFENLVGQGLGFTRPREGDVIYFPLNKKLWEIRHVEHEANFYALGKLYSCDLRCELFEFSGERFETGLPEVDSIAERYDYADTTLETIEDHDSGADNETIEDVASNLIDYTEPNIFGDERF